MGSRRDLLLQGRRTAPGRYRCRPALTTAHPPGAPGPVLTGPGAFWSGVDWRAGPKVEAERLHDGERGGPGEDLDVGGGQHAGVLGDDRRGGAVGDGVQVGFDPGPGVLPVPHVKGHRVDGGQRLLRAGFDVGDVLLVHVDVVAGGEPAEVPADEVLPWIGQRGGRGRHVAGHVLAEVEVVDRHPAGVDHIDEHQRVVAGEVDVDVVRRVVGAVPGQFHALAADLEGVTVGEGHFWRWPGRVVVAEQQP